MHLETLSLQDWICCFGQKPVAIDLKSGINAFVGNNSFGKTALLEVWKRLFSRIATERQIRKIDAHCGPTEDLQILNGLDREIVIDTVFGFETPTAYPWSSAIYFSRRQTASSGSPHADGTDLLGQQPFENISEMIFTYV